MKPGWTLLFGLLAATTASAHRVDEYLQAALIAIEADRIEVDLRLTPGMAIAEAIIASIDTDRDGQISSHEQQAYAARVLQDVALRLNQTELELTLVSTEFAGIGELKEGVGEIRLQLAAKVSPVAAEQNLRWENVHRRDISVYQVNVLVPRDAAIQLGPERRTYSQSAYELNYLQAAR